MSDGFRQEKEPTRAELAKLAAGLGQRYDIATAYATELKKQLTGAFQVIAAFLEGGEIQLTQEELDAQLGAQITVTHLEDGNWLFAVVPAPVAPTAEGAETPA